MAIPYRARVDERRFLNLPGFHGGAYVVAYVEDTSDRHPDREQWCDDDCSDCPHNFEPRMILEIADCNRCINLELDVDSEAGRLNSLHKLDTLIAALRVLRTGVVEEFAEYDRRERELEELKGVSRRAQDQRPGLACDARDPASSVLAGWPRGSTATTG